MKPRKVEEDPAPPFKISFSPLSTPATLRRFSAGSPQNNLFSPSKLMLFSPSPTPAKTMVFHKDPAGHQVMESAYQTLQNVLTEKVKALMMVLSHVLSLSPKTKLSLSSL